MSTPRRILLTPGPLTTTDTVKAALVKDWGSRDRDFIALNADVRRRVVEVADGVGTHTCVPIQGSGTFAVEATLGTLVPRKGTLLVLTNGAYGRRMVTICRRNGTSVVEATWSEEQQVQPNEVANVLANLPQVSHVAVVHCETTSGVLNPLADIARVVKAAGKILIVDAMSSFGGIPLSVAELGIDALVASSNKDLEGVPGLGYAVVREDLLAGCAGNSPSLSLDLHEQWVTMEKTRQWRFTPPVQVIAAFHQALVEHEQEGGTTARFQRYSHNCRVLVDGMRAVGFHTLLPDAIQAPIIVTFLSPGDPRFNFEHLYRELGEQGIVIYPGKLTEAPSFRIGCIGQVFPEDLRRAVDAVNAITAAMGVNDRTPAAASVTTPVATPVPSISTTA